ncbi:MAG: host-nuclease inhibitor Gam family protein [Treponema sp.]|nr:host-nuclease inhibitor Gam family protein [Treponema sp.]
MARYKPRTGKIKTLVEANLALKEIGMLEHELAAIDAEGDKQIAEIKAAAAREGDGLRKRIVDLTASLGVYAEYNRDDLFRDRKSVDLVFGSLGFRQSTSIHVKKTTLELLKKLGLGNCVRLKEEPDKDAMKELPDDTLAQVDAVRKVEDKFFAETNKEEINKELLKEQIAS